MKKKEFETYLHKHYPELFSFAFSLIPDDLQAGQIVIDSISSFMLKEKELVQKLLDSEEKEDEEELSASIFLRLISEVYHLGVKRFPHLESSLDTTKQKRNFKAFYALTTKEKALLYLKHKLAFSIDNMALAMNKTKTEVISSLEEARLNLGNYLGMDFTEGMIPH